MTISQEKSEAVNGRRDSIMTNRKKDNRTKKAPYNTTHETED